MTHTILEFLQVGTFAGVVALGALLLIKHSLTFEDKDDRS